MRGAIAVHRIFYITIGVMSSLLGIFIIIIPAFYSSYLHQYVDLTKIKWPFGGGLTILGAAFIWSSFRKKAIEAERRAREEKKVYICPRCVKAFFKKDALTLKCPQCGNMLEKLTGFYERHPELKDKEIE